MPLPKLISSSVAASAVLPLLAGAAGAVVALVPLPALAVDCTPFEPSKRSVSVNGNGPKTLGVIKGTWTQVQSCIIGSPWWDSNQSAGDYAVAYRDVLLSENPTGTLPESFWLYPNTEDGAGNNSPSDVKDVGPLVAWGLTGNANGKGNGKQKVSTRAVRRVSSSNQANTFPVDLDVEYYWIVDPNGASAAPAPLPLIGGAAALLWSRRLRRRVARGRRATG